MPFMTSLDIDALWKDMSPCLKRYISGRVSDSSIAEDILQETFLKAHSQIDTLRDIHSLQSWIYRIARNTIIDHYRSTKPMSELPEVLVAPPPEDGDVVDELIPCVQSMVHKLPEKYRLAIILTEYEGMTQKEMGEKLGLSLSGAKSRAQRAREKLKTMLIQCCHFELDGHGGVISYERRAPSIPCH